MNSLVSEIKAATQPKAGRKNKNKYEYDSDEDIEGGTWEHKARVKEMKQTEGIYMCVLLVMQSRKSADILYNILPL